MDKKTLLSTALLLTIAFSGCKKEAEDESVISEREYAQSLEIQAQERNHVLSSRAVVVEQIGVIEREARERLGEGASDADVLAAMEADERYAALKAKVEEFNQEHERVRLETLRKIRERKLKLMNEDLK